MSSRGIGAALEAGLSADRVARLMREAVARVGLDLSGTTVLTEAATGAYGVTAPIAALAGAKRVVAVARSSAYGTASEAAAWTRKLAAAAGVTERITYSEALPQAIETIDLVTNSGHLRPIDAALVRRLHPDALIALMFEAWELRDGDIDVAACRECGIRIVGVNERHPAVDVFSYLGPTCASLLLEGGIPVYRSRIALLCDNDFAPFLARALRGLGGDVALFEFPGAVPRSNWDCIVVALRPLARQRVAAREAEMLARVAPTAVVAQIWGDIDRAALIERGLAIVPATAPKPGHMAVLLSRIGPEPIVRLQSGGLKAAEHVLRGGSITPDGIAQPV
jgi:hypothetical protein